MDSNVLIKLIESIGDPYLLFITLITSIICVIINNITLWIK